MKLFSYCRKIKCQQIVSRAKKSFCEKCIETTHNEKSVVKDDFWIRPDLNKEDKFLRDYVLNKKFLEKDETFNLEREIDNLSDEEKEVKEQVTFEEKYNCRFEEFDEEFFKRYPHTLKKAVSEKTKKVKGVEHENIANVPFNDLKICIKQKEKKIISSKLNKSNKIKKNKVKIGRTKNLNNEMKKGESMENKTIVHESISSLEHELIPIPLKPNKSHKIKNNKLNNKMSENNIIKLLNDEQKKSDSILSKCKIKREKLHVPVIKTTITDEKPLQKKILERKLAKNKRTERVRKPRHRVLAKMNNIHHTPNKYLEKLERGSDQKNSMLRINTKREGNNYSEEENSQIPNNILERKAKKGNKKIHISNLEERNKVCLKKKLRISENECSISPTKKKKKNKQCTEIDKYLGFDKIKALRLREKLLKKRRRKRRHKVVMKE